MTADPTPDLVERLKAKVHGGYPDADAIAAADEIERLQAELREANKYAARYDAVMETMTVDFEDLFPFGTPMTADTPTLRDADGFWHPELLAEVEAAIRRTPNMDAEWWIGGSAALGVVEKWLGLFDDR